VSGKKSAKKRDTIAGEWAPGRHSEETKAAILANLIAGATIRATAEALDVPPTTVHRIAHANSEQIGTEKGTMLSDRIFSLLEEIIESNIVAARLLQDSAYIRQQRPSDLAILAGTQMDKAFRILVAMERGRQRRNLLPSPDPTLAGKESLTKGTVTDQDLHDIGAGLDMEAKQ